MEPPAGARQHPAGTMPGGYGYLLTHFVEDPHGHAEQVYFALSVGDDPLRYRRLNGGSPALRSTIGTTGVRDPFVVRRPRHGDGAKAEPERYFLLATDLRVWRGRTDDNSDAFWDAAQRHGSTDLLVWESDDLLTWTGPRPLDVTPRDGALAGRSLGMAWAPEAVWEPDLFDDGRGGFVVLWSSRVYGPDDPEHRASTHDVVLWGTTEDFAPGSFEVGGIFVDTGRDAIDATVLRRGSRTYRATKGASDDDGIWLDRTDAPRWWEPGTPWTTLRTRLGATVAHDGRPWGVEGPALFSSHAGDVHHLFVDGIPDIGYRPLVADDLEGEFVPVPADGYLLPPMTKHGGVLPLTRDEHARLDAHLPR